MKNLENVLMVLAVAGLCLTMFGAAFAVFVTFMDANMVTIAIIMLAFGASMSVWLFYIIMEELFKK